jgi:hypothetical protein
VRHRPITLPDATSVAAPSGAGGRPFRRARRRIAAALVLAALLPVGCGRGNRPAAGGVPPESATATTIPTSAGAAASGPPLRLIDPCGLATQEEFAAALGTHFKQPGRAGSSNSDITCVVQSAANSSATSILLSCTSPRHTTADDNGHDRVH